MIAADALASDLPVYACDAGGFGGIDGLVFVDLPISGADLGKVSGSA
jgi:hypothetical protein